MQRAVEILWPEAPRLYIRTCAELCNPFEHSFGGVRYVLALDGAEKFEAQGHHGQSKGGV